MVSTQYGSTRYRSESLGELVTLVETAHAPGIWSNLAFDLSDAQHQRNVSVTLDLQGIEVRFYGADATWVYGQDARLRELLSSYDGTIEADTGRLEVALFLFLSIMFLLGTVAYRTGIASSTDGLSAGVFAMATAVTSTTCLFLWAKYRATAHKWSAVGEVTSGALRSRLSLQQWLIVLPVIFAGMATVTGIVALVAGP